MTEGTARAPPQDVGGRADALVNRLVRAERVRALYARNGVAQATVLLNSILVAVVLWGRAPSAVLVAWAACTWALAGLRLAGTFAYRRAAPPAEDARRWERRYILGAAANGAVWGAAPLLLAATLPVAEMVFLAFVLGGMVAGSALSNTSRQRAFLAFTIPALLPMTAALLLGGDRLRVVMGVLLAIFGAALYLISRLGGQALDEATRLRFAKAELATSLAGLNAELEARVAERSAQLEAAGKRALEAERRLSGAARLAMLGTLAGGVAHEINNPLTYVKANLSYVREELSRVRQGAALPASLDEALAEASDGAERVRRIVCHLMLLSRVSSDDEPHPVDLHAALELCAEMAKGEIEPRARLVRDYGTVPPVLGDPSRIMQVFMNLLYNAAQAIPAGDAGHNEIRISTRADDAGEVVVEISDTGCGFPAASLERIWDPFFTTRQGEPGTGLGLVLGLGLAISRNLVGSLGGRIAVRSAEGAGSTFTVWLRAAPRSAAAGVEGASVAHAS